MTVGTIAEEFVFLMKEVESEHIRIMGKPQLVADDIRWYKTTVLTVALSFDTYFKGQDEHPQLRTQLQKRSAQLLNQVIDRYESQEALTR